MHAVVRFRSVVVEKRLAAAFPHADVAERRRMGRDSYVHLALTLLWFLRQPTLDLEQGAHTTDALIDAGDAGLSQFRAEVFEVKRNAIVMTGDVGE